MKKLVSAFILLITFNFLSCKETTSKDNEQKQHVNSEASNTKLTDSLVIYRSENLVIKKLSNRTYQHISFLDTDDFGKVGCNGMLVVNENEAVLFDTPTDNKSSLELILFVTKELKCEITAVIPTHFHDDCIGGIQKFEEQNIPTYATKQTVELLEKKGHIFSKSVNEFETSLTLNIGSKKVYAEYLGQGHTIDNIIGYFPEDKAIFGGCLVKNVGANRGYLGDANTNEWSETVRKIKLKYSETEIVIPGHGKPGSVELLDYTIELFEIE